MAKFTVEMSRLIDSGFDFGMTGYPIYDEAHRAVLNQKILDHYRLYEIGVETAGQFKFVLNRALNERMPLFNQRYQSCLLEIQPLLSHSMTDDETRNIDVSGSDDSTVTNDSTMDTVRKDTRIATNTHDGSITTTNDLTDTRDTTVDNKHVQSDTPSKLLAIGDITGNVYASKAEIDDDAVHDAMVRTGTVGVSRGLTDGIDDVLDVDGLDTGHMTNVVERVTGNNTVDKLLRTTSGFTKSQSKLLTEFRNTFLNIDMEVVSSLSDLFMNIW